MSPPKKKKRKTTKPLLKPSPTLESYSISSVPDDLVISCLARVSRLYYPTLSLVSKKFRSLISSPELYKVRSLLGCTESCLYVCLHDSDTHCPHWFTICWKPNTLKTKKKKKKSIGNILVPIPFPQSTQVRWSKVVAIGSSIYSIGGHLNNAPSSIVSVLDCRSHTWHQAPSMQVARRFLSANVIDGKIYVIGDRVDQNSSSWIEVFDPETQIWKSVSNHGHEICSSEIIDCTSIDGKIYMSGCGKCVAYNPKDGTFKPIELNMHRGWVYYSHCVVDNMLFYYSPHGKVFKWYDTKARLWRDLKGLEGIKRKIDKLSNVILVDYDEKIAVFWDKYISSRGSREKMIWLAEISLERRRNDEEAEDEIWGRVEFVDCVLTVPKSYNVLKAISATM